MSSHRRLLFFSQILALPNHHGGCAYSHAVLTELHRQGVTIEYAWLGRPLAGGRRLMRDPLVAPFIARGWVRGTRKLGQFLVPDTPGGWFSSQRDPTEAAAATPEHLPTNDEKTFAASLIRRLAPTAVLIDGTCNLPILDSLAPAERARMRVGVLTVNLQSRRTDLYRAYGQPFDFLPMTAAEESALLTRADLVVAIQEREAESFRALLPGADVVTVPMPIVPQPQPPARAISGRCLFVGGYSGHNIEAVQWLVRDIWPQVRAVMPAAELVIAGTVGQAVKGPCAGVRVVGPLADLRTAYAETTLSLVPLPMGTGLKIKLVEAMGYGRAVVTTDAGAEGFADVEAGHVAVLANDAAGFASAIIRLLESETLRNEVSRRQLAWIEKVLKPSVAIAPLDRLWPAWRHAKNS